MPSAKLATAGSNAKVRRQMLAQKLNARTSNRKNISSGLIFGLVASILIFLRAVPFQFQFNHQDPFSKITTISQLNKNYYNWVVYLIGVICIALPFINGRRIHVKQQSIYPILFLLYASISCFWSDTPVDSVRPVIYLGISILLGAFVASQLTIVGQVRAYGFAMMISLVLSIIYVFAFPKYGIHHANDAFEAGLHTGQWRGIFIHKNGLGSLSAGIIILALIGGRQNFGRKDIWFASVTLATVSLIKTNDVTALLSLILSISIYFALFRLSGIVRYTSICFSLALSATLLYSGTNLYSMVTSALGRSENLSSRTQIWASTIPAVRASPIFGYGFQSGYGGARALLAKLFGVDHPHNNFVDIMLSGGVIFLMIYLIWVIAALGAAWKISNGEPHLRRAGQAILVLLIFCFFNGASESTLKEGGPMDVIYFCLASGIMFRSYRSKLELGTRQSVLLRRPFRRTQTQKAFEVIDVAYPAENLSG